MSRKLLFSDGYFLLFKHCCGFFGKNKSGLAMSLLNNPDLYLSDYLHSSWHQRTSRTGTVEKLLRCSHAEEVKEGGKGGQHDYRGESVVIAVLQ